MKFLIPIFFLCAIIPAIGCQSQSQPARIYFDAAEEAYRTGQYEVAHQKYSLFLRQNPDPQLTRLAERRILSIEREIECVFGQKSGPRPSYINREVTGEMPLKHPPVIYKSNTENQQRDL